MKFARMLAIGLSLATVPALARAEDQTAATATPAALPVPAAPARIAAARETVNAIFPAGTYARIMNGSLSGMMSSMMDSMFAMPVADLAAMSGRKPEELQKIGKTSTAQIMAILDPAFRQRTQITMSLMMSEIGGVMTEFEPTVREAYVAVYARRYSESQLTELNRFFATPTGKAYAADSMVIGTEPEVLAKMQGVMPLIMKRMPVMMEKLKAEMAKLPPPRKPKDLSPAEKAELQKLLGGPVAK